MRELAHAGDTATVVHGVSFSKALHYHFVKFYWDIGGAGVEDQAEGSG